MSYLDEVLKKLGWEDGFQIPVANYQNQELEREVARLTLAKVRAKGAFETSNLKLDNLRDHLKHVKQEGEENQSLITAHTQELRKEEHKLRVEIAERDKYDQEIRTFCKKQSDVCDRQNLHKNHLERLVQKLEKLRAETDWDTEALKAWEESLKKRDDDNEIIKRFSKEDEKKYNELEARRQNLEQEYSNRKAMVETMVSEISNYERMLERTGKVMEQQNDERNALIKQWKDAVAILQSRDRDINLLQTQIVEMREVIDKETEKLHDQNDFLRTEMRNNEELEMETRQLNAQNSRLRREHNDLTQYIYLLNNQADGLRRTLINTNNHLLKERNNTKCISVEIESMENRIRRHRIKVDELHEKYRNLTSTFGSVEEQARHLQKVLDQEQLLAKTLQNDNELMQSQYFRCQRDLQDLVNLQKVKDLEIYGVAASLQRMRKHVDDTRKQIEKLKEDAYDLDFKIDDVQRRIMMNESIYYGDDKEILEAKHLELEVKRGEHLEVKNLLKDQVHKIRDDMRRLTTAIVADQSQLVELQNKLQDQMVRFEGGNKQLEAMKTAFKRQQVDENLLRLRVDHLERSMKKETKSIYTLNKFKLSLEQATRERMLEIETQKEILAVKKRTLSEDKGRLKADICECRIRLDQFRKKYEITLTSLGKDENGETFSVTHFKIRNAQEKFMLQQRGDELDDLIKKAEKEIVAMENTLKVINVTNGAFKQSLGVVEDEGEEVKEMRRLEGEVAQLAEAQKLRRRELNKKRQELEEMQEQLAKMEQQNTEEKDALASLEEEYVRIEMDKTGKEEKFRRAERCLKLAQKKVSESDITKYKQDLEIRQLRETNCAALQKLKELTEKRLETLPLIGRYESEYGIAIIGKKRSRSEASSVRSSVSAENTSTKSASTQSGLSKVLLQFDAN